MLTVCLLIGLFGDTIEFFDSDGLLGRNSLLVFLESISYFFLELVGVLTIFEFVLVLVG